MKLLMVVLAAALLLAACAMGSPEAERLLLTPSDAPDLQLSVVEKASDGSVGAGGIAQTLLEGGGLEIVHSLVIFGDAGEATRIMENLRQEADELPGEVRPAPDIGDEALLLVRASEEGEVANVPYRTGRIQGRVAVRGPGAEGHALQLAEIAANRARAAPSP